MLNRPLILLICASLTLILFLPKINIIGVAGENAGIRIDDLILLCAGACLFFAHVATRRLLEPLEILVGAIFFASLVSFILNVAFVATGYLQMQASILYPLRLVEYFVFFYGGLALARIGSLNRVLAALLLWYLLVMLLQYKDLIGAFSVSGYSASSSDRVRGLAAHPAELGLVLNLMFCGLAFSPRFSGDLRAREFFFVLGLFLIILFCLALSGSRITCVSQVILYLGWLLSRKIRWPFVRTALTVAVIGSLCLAVPYFLKGSSVADRSLNLLSLHNLSLPMQLYRETDPDAQTFQEAARCSLSLSTLYDTSWLMRLHKWSYVIKLLLMRPFCWLFGIGPGACGPALDGGLLRIVVENGVVGALLYGAFFVRIARMGSVLFWSVIALGLSTLFIDSYVSYKPMTLFFFVAGYYASTLRRA